MRSNPASKAAHQPIVSDNHTQTHTHTHTSTPTDYKPCPKQQPKICPTSTQNRSPNLTKSEGVVSGKNDFHRTENKLLWAASTVRKKVALVAFSCAGSRLIDMEGIFGSLCVPTHLSIPCGPCQHSFISPAPTSQPQKHTPGVIQSSPHTHPNHKKKNGLCDPTQSRLLHLRPTPSTWIMAPAFLFLLLGKMSHLCFLDHVFISDLEPI